ncbi:Protein kinase-like domain superfamily [Arabidopsis thaliana x Arabidopsis arenosa]|uniref:non-specific serine/threonine protein kinase n=1 Tax=Arabidopsis thaliana x Arabidopsis arenosa TaxID=1240361 RepID=A0A8T2BM11_9BRAS|nr:Protein kinase-like domain superfamily [Arabidopsis thaliana x Arabidopsis arenosa]
MSDSPSSSPPAPSADSAPPPDSSTGGSAPPPTDSSPPPADSSPPPVVSSPPPPPDSSPPPLVDLTPPPSSSPPPPPADAPPPVPIVLPPPPPPPVDSPPPESTNSPPPPEVFEPPPPPPNADESPPAPPPPEQLPPPASSPQAGPKTPEKHPPGPTKSPSAPAISPPAPPYAPPHNTSHALPPKSTAAGGPLNSPSRGVPSPPNGYQGKTMVGFAVAGFAVIALMAVVFLVRRKKKRNIDAYSDSQYLPPSNFSIKSDGFLYGQNPTKGYSGPGGYNSQQHSNSGNSFGSQRGGGGGYTRSGSAPDSAVMGSGQTHFTYEELTDITEGFSKQNILGEGGFGCVYKGKLNDGKLVAVKQLKVGSGQGDREFKAEVEIISRVHHRHLVSLVGYCISDSERLLIYEYVPNQTLEHHLHGKGRPVLEWARRVRIAIGSAKGLAYLHEDCHPKIIHRDIKSANILLDDEFEAQAIFVADFGLAKLNDSTQTHVSTRVMGTFGYLAPEYAQSGKLTDRSDVFSFGVVLLELITGRKPVDQYQPLGEESLVEWARPLLHKAIETGDFSELVDRRLEKHYVENEVFRMIETAAACVRHSGPKRPRMVQFEIRLDSEGDMGDISNGNKVGQSSAYDSGQYNNDTMKFRKMAFGFDDSSDSGMYSGEYFAQGSRKGSNGASSEFTRNESENRNFNNRRF